MTTDLVAYLSFDGECEAAFRLYEKVLGGKVLMMMHHADAPAERRVKLEGCGLHGGASLQTRALALTAPSGALPPGAFAPQVAVSKLVSPEAAMT
jgi:PhnB protein